MPQFRCMKGELAPENLSDLRYPLIASEKIDGWRCIVAPIDWARRTIPCDPKHQHYFDRAQHCIALSASNKPISNLHVQRMLDRPELGGCDGELIASAAFNETSSNFATILGEPGFAFHIFDRFDRPNDPFHARLQQLSTLHLPHIPNVELLKHPQHEIHSARVLEEFVGLLLEEGAEGAVVRSPLGPYKYGRSTAKQGWLLKVKPVEDFEAIVIGYEQGYINDNPIEYDQRGLARRSSSQANQIPDDILGALVCGLGGVQFKVGIFKGFTKDELRRLWKLRNTLPGRIVKLQKMKHGELNKPRSCRCLGFRSEDLST